jgi:threonine synthase
VLEDSSGNGGAAVSAYAAAGGMQAKIMVPASTSPAKTVQSRAAGATIELVPGSRQDCADAAERDAANRFYASHNWHPFFLHGTKTLAYELWEDGLPDNVIVPCGAGSNVLGLHIGFSELLRAGQITRMPKIFAAQPANCGPIARAALGLPAQLAQPTIAEGTAIAQPLRAAECIAAMRESGGGAVLLEEAEIAEASLMLARRGIYVEPTCAQAAAAFSRLLAAGSIAAREATVVVLTGTGLKATPRYAEFLGVSI